MISVSLGIMNLLPIPPLDGGRFVVEIYQRLRRRVVSPRTRSTA
jgi:regulator of sigma E protease